MRCGSRTGVAAATRAHGQHTRVHTLTHSLTHSRSHTPRLPAILSHGAASYPQPDSHRARSENMHGRVRQRPEEQEGRNLAEEARHEQPLRGLQEVCIRVAASQDKENSDQRNIHHSVGRDARQALQADRPDRQAGHDENQCVDVLHGHQIATQGSWVGRDLGLGCGAGCCCLGHHGERGQRHACARAGGQGGAGCPVSEGREWAAGLAAAPRSWKARCASAGAKSPAGSARPGVARTLLARFRATHWPALGNCPASREPACVPQSCVPPPAMRFGDHGGPQAREPWLARAAGRAGVQRRSRLCDREQRAAVPHAPGTRATCRFARSSTGGLLDLAALPPAQRSLPRDHAASSSLGRASQT